MLIAVCACALERVCVCIRNFFQEPMKAFTFHKRQVVSLRGCLSRKSLSLQALKFVNGSLKCRLTLHIKHKKERGGGRLPQISMFLKPRDEAS